MLSILIIAEKDQEDNANDNVHMPLASSESEDFGAADENSSAEHGLAPNDPGGTEQLAEEEDVLNGALTTSRGR